MDPQDNSTNPTPFNGGQAPDSSTPSSPPAAPTQEVTVDFNQGVPANSSLGTINDNPRPDMASNPAQQAGPATPPTAGYDSNAVDPSYASSPSMPPQNPSVPPQVPPAGAPVSQPADFGDSQASLPPQTTPLDPAQNLPEQHPAHVPGADKKTVFILAGVAVVLVIAIATLLFL